MYTILPPIPHIILLKKIEFIIPLGSYQQINNNTLIMNKLINIFPKLLQTNRVLFFQNAQIIAQTNVKDFTSKQKEKVTFETFTTSDLQKLGYGKAESIWIVNMRDASHMSKDQFDNKIDECGHTGGTYNYTKSIVDKIQRYGFYEWKNNSLHLGYGDMFLMYQIIPNFANNLLTHNFSSSNEKKYLKIFKKDFKNNMTDDEKRQMFSNLIKQIK